MKQKTIFFDLDDTLYDRFIPYQKAFRQFFGDRYAEKLPQAFDAVLHRGYEVFAAAHTGKISMRQMHVYRHQTGLADVGIAVTEDEALEMQALYAAQQRQITLTDTMRQVLDFCKGHFAAVGVITNGGVRSQQDKLQSLGISQWVSPELVFISDAHRTFSGWRSGPPGRNASTWAIPIRRMLPAQPAAAGQRSG